MHTHKMFVLSRKDLSETYRLVQGAHALAKFALEYHDRFELWNNSTIVFLGVHNLKVLREWNLKLIKNNKQFSIFKEPDLDFQETAICCYDDG